MRSNARLGDFHGSLAGSLDAGAFRVCETLHRAGARLEPHAHERASFCMVIEGGFVETWSSRDRACAPSDVLFRPAGARHADAFGARASRCLNVEIATPCVERARETGAPLDAPGAWSGGAVADAARRLHAELRVSDDLSPLAIEGLVLELTAHAARESRRGAESAAPRWLLEARDVLRDAWTAPPPLGAIAARVGRHPVHLAREFHRYFGSSMGECVRRLRVERARGALETSDDSITAIALACGFADHSHFARTFRRITGETPSAFRARARR